MAFTLLTSGGAATGSSGSTTAGLNCAGANLIVIAVVYVTAAGRPTPTDSNLNTYTFVAEATSATWSTAIFQCLTPAVGGSMTFAAVGGLSRAAICVQAYSVGGTTSALDQTGANAGTAPGTLTPTAAGEVIVCAIGAPRGSAPANAITAGFTVTNTEVDGTSGAQSMAMAYLIETSIVAVNPSWSGGAGTSAGTAIASWQATGGPVDTPLDGDPAAVTVAPSTAVLAQGEMVSPAAVTVAPSTAVLAQGEMVSPAAVTVVGSAALLTGGIGAAPAAVVVGAAPAALRISTGAAPGTVVVVGRPAALRLAVGDAPGAVLVVGSAAELRRSAESSPGHVVVIGAPALLVALSPPGPPPPPPPTPVTGGARRAARPRPPAQQVYGTIPPWIGDGPAVPPAGG
jgi:hypothetical protein